MSSFLPEATPSGINDIKNKISELSEKLDKLSAPDRLGSLVSRLRKDKLKAMIALARAQTFLAEVDVLAADYNLNEVVDELEALNKDSSVASDKIPTSATLRSGKKCNPEKETEKLVSSTKTNLTKANTPPAKYIPTPINNTGVSHPTLQTQATSDLKADSLKRVCKRKHRSRHRSKTEEENIPENKKQKATQLFIDYPVKISNKATLTDNRITLLPTLNSVRRQKHDQAVQTETLKATVRNKRIQTKIKAPSKLIQTNEVKTMSKHIQTELKAPPVTKEVQTDEVITATIARKVQTEHARTIHKRQTTGENTLQKQIDGEIVHKSMETNREDTSQPRIEEETIQQSMQTTNISQKRIAHDSVHKSMQTTRGNTPQKRIGDEDTQLVASAPTSHSTAINLARVLRQVMYQKSSFLDRQAVSEFLAQSPVKLGILFEDDLNLKTEAADTAIQHTSHF